MSNQLHADHVDTSGAYAQKFEVIKSLVDSGVLTDIPAEFTTRAVVSQTVEVVNTSAQTEQFDMSNGHADHVDDTGAYRMAYEEKYGVVKDVQTSAGNSWKGFLQQIIAEEKSKLKV
jgi:hypothetical protein